MEELKQAIKKFVDNKAAFTTYDIKLSIEEIAEESGKYVDQLPPDKLKEKIIELFENGEMPGYAILAQPMINEDGPFFVLEFTPNNPMNVNIIDMLELPIGNQKVVCRIHPYYKEFVKFLSKQSGVSQDMIVRSLLTRSLSLIIDQFK